MRTPLFLVALALPAIALSAAKPPPFPESFNVAGADCESVGHLIHRLPEKIASLSGEYDSHSITDGRQKLKLHLHANGNGEWLVDGTLTTDYGIEPPEVVKFTNIPLQTNGKAAWFETGIPNLVGYSVNFLRPRLSRDDPSYQWGPAVLIGDSIYTQDQKAKAGGKPTASKSKEARK
jgi:hypothetical protein